MIFRNIYNDYKELKKEVEYYSHECYLKEQRIRELKKQIKELKGEKPKRGRPRKEVKND